MLRRTRECQPAAEVAVKHHPRLWKGSAEPRLSGISPGSIQEIGWEDSPVFELPNDAIAPQSARECASLRQRHCQGPGHADSVGLFTPCRSQDAMTSAHA